MVTKDKTSKVDGPEEKKEKGKYIYGPDERSHLAQCFCPRTTWLDSEYAEKEKEQISSESP